MKRFVPFHSETPAEEVANSITHGLGVLLSIAGLATLVTLAALSGDARRIVTMSIYGCTLLIAYVASMCYHIVRSPQIKRALRIFDHTGIYLLIAGTYTPIVLVSMRGGWGWSLFGVIWGLAVVGIVIKFFFIDHYELLGVALYVVMGWLAMIAIHPMAAALGFGGMAWMLGGGVAYTAGIAFFCWDHLPFNHAIWHLFVLAGSICHYLAVLLYVLPISGLAQ